MNALPAWSRPFDALVVATLAAGAAPALATVGADAPSTTVVCQRYRWCSLPKAPVGDWYLGGPQAGGRDRLDAWSVWAVDSGTLMLRAEKEARSVDVLLRQASGQTRLLRLIPVEPQVGPPVQEVPLSP